MSAIELPPGPRVNPALVQLVEQLMTGVLAGQITSLACVTIGPLGQMQWPGVGMQMAEMMIGAEMMRDDMKAAMRNAGASKILRAG